MRPIFVIAIMVIASFGPSQMKNAKAIQDRRAASRRKSPASVAKTQVPRRTGTLVGLDQYVAEVMKKLPVTPGLAIAVVRGDKVIFAGGFGYRDVKSKLSATPQTAFYIASTTKSFTGTAAKMLDDEGKIDLDVPIKTYFPNLVLKSPLSTEQISLRDLLTHRSGINNEPIEFRTAYTGQYDTEEIFKLLSSVTRPISPAFNYSNLGYIITGYAMEKATGEPWQKIIQQKILDPLGMQATTCYASKVKANSNYALPYLSENGTFVELPYKQDNTMHAAGGMASSAEDLAKWLIMNMNEGRYDGKQIIPAASLEEILSPQINQKRRFYKFERYAYGLGWNIGMYEGNKLMHCFGSYEGFRPHVSFMPAQRIGVVVLANENRDTGLLPDLIASDIYDHLLYQKPFQVSSNQKVQEYIADLQKNREARAKRAAARESEREKGTTLTLELRAYAGTYENPGYGRIVIALQGAALVASFGNLSSPLEHYSRDVFEATFIPGNTYQLIFKASKPDGITGVSVLGQPFAKVQPAS